MVRSASPLAAGMYTELGGLNKWVHIWPYKDLAERNKIREEAGKNEHSPPPTWARPPDRKPRSSPPKNRENAMTRTRTMTNTGNDAPLRRRCSRSSERSSICDRQSSGEPEQDEAE